jgi:hypothetical protein
MDNLSRIDKLGCQDYKIVQRIDVTFLRIFLKLANELVLTARFKIQERAWYCII